MDTDTIVQAQIDRDTQVKATDESKSGNGEQPLQSLYGLWKDSGAAIGPEEIDDLRREMWGRFPRHDV